MKVFACLWKDEAGFVVSSELVLIATVMVIGMLTGLATVRDQVVQELSDVADAVSEINQSYHYTAITGHTSSTAGSLFDDTNDQCDPDGNNGSGVEPNCLSILQPATPET